MINMRIGHTKIANNDRTCYWNGKYLYNLKNFFELNSFGFQIILIIKAMLQSNSNDSRNSNKYRDETMNRL